MKWTVLLSLCFAIFGFAVPALGDEASLRELYSRYTDEWQKFGDQHLDTLSRLQNGLRGEEWAVLTLFLTDVHLNAAAPEVPDAGTLKKIKAISRSSPFLRYRLLMTEALLLAAKGQIKESLANLTAAEALAEQTGFINDRAEASLAVLRLLLRIGQQDQAIQRLEILLKWLESDPDQLPTLVQENIRISAAFVYDSQGQSERAISTLEEVIQRLRQTQLKSTDIPTLINLATLKKKAGSSIQLKQAIALFQEVIQLSTEFGIELYKGMAASAIAGIYRRQKDFIQAERYARQGWESLKGLNPALATLTRNEWGLTLVELNRWDEAERISLELEGILPRDHVEAYVSFLDLKIKIARHKGDWQRAFLYLQEQSIIHQTQAEQQKTQNIAEAEARVGMKFEAEKNQLLIREKSLEAQKLRITRQHNRLMIYGIGGGLILLLVLAGIHRALQISRSRRSENSPHEAVATILFCDLGDFTAHTERLSADAIARVLSTFFIRMTEIIFEEKGTIDTCIGAATMVLFGPPRTLSPEAQALHALACAEKMQAVLQQLNQSWEQEFGCSFRARIGIHQGSVEGLALNTAARIGDVTAPDEIWVTQEIRQHIKTPSESVGVFPLKGLEQPVELFQIKKNKEIKSSSSA